jgi:hypothetical protein
VKRAYVMVVLLGCVAASAHADVVMNGKLQCDIQYGEQPETRTACQRGVELAARASDAEDAIRSCTRDFAKAEFAAICQRGVALHTRLANRQRADGEQSFSYSWTPKRGAAEVRLGDYQVFVGDAERSIDECMRAFEGNSNPPSCMSGLTVQRKPRNDAQPAPPPR